MESNYSVSNITVMEGLDAVRMRPGMYIGTTGPKGLHHLLWEIVDNAIDEAANGYANEISVTLNKDGSATVFDNGRGIPVGIHEKLGVSGVEVVFTQLHAGGKFGYDSYGYSGGLHGVGASVVNALSRWVTVEVFTQNRSYKQEFESAEGPDGKIVSGRPKYPLTETGRTRKQGSLITFMPDDRVFETVEWSYEPTTLAAVENLTEQGYQVWAVEQVEGSVMLQDFRMEQGCKYAMVFGNEVAGVDQAVVDKCCGAVEIPQRGTKHSINVSVSGGVVLWTLFCEYQKLL